MMHLEPLLHHRDLLPRQSGSCVQCPNPPPCNCAANENCFQITRDCYNCGSFQCAPVSTSASGSGGSGGVSKGALAGAIVGVLIFLAGAISLFLWYRRRLIARRSVPTREVKPDIPAAAETVLNRPDPTEKPTPSPTENSVRVYSTHSDTTIDLDPESQGPSTTPSSNPFNSLRSSTQSNPFGDGHSIQTTSTGTQDTNVIPIAFVPPGSVSSGSTSSQGDSSYSGVPLRPARAPDLNLNLDHVNVSRDELRALTPYAHSARSGISTASSRNSYMSSASYSSEFLHEAPVIITPTQGAVRQVLGVHKAEMFQTPGSLPSTPMTADSLKPSVSAASRPSIRSPLAATSFTPADALKESDVEEEQEIYVGNPFDDKHSKSSPSASVTTFGTPSPRPADTYDSSPERGIPESRLPWAQSRDFSSTRPSSMNTQAGSIIDIGSATRVNVGLLSPDTRMMTSSLPTTPQPPKSYRTTIGRLMTPPSSSASAGTLEEQQQQALAHAQAQAQAQGLERSKRVSGASAVSATSTKADSILESFPFVPPSPISDRPIRSPPRSPLGQQAFTGGSTSKEATKHPQVTKLTPPPDSATLPPLAPPNRKFLGLSTGSQLSNVSTGLGSFPFQIDSGNGSDAGHGSPPSSFPPSGFQGQRASLDTLALTSDLSSYPLGFDRDNRDSFPPSKV